MSSCTWPSCLLNLVPSQWGHLHQPAAIRLPKRAGYPALFLGRQQEVVVHHTTGRRVSNLSITPGKGMLGSRWKSDTHHAGKPPWAVTSLQSTSSFKPGNVLLKLLFSRQVVSDSLWPHWLHYARLPCPVLLYLLGFAQIHVHWASDAS